MSLFQNYHYCWVYTSKQHKITSFTHQWETGLAAADVDPAVLENGSDLNMSLPIDPPPPATPLPAPPAPVDVD